MSINKVLVVIDPETEQQPALDRTLTLARTYDFDVVLMACDYTSYLVEGYYFDAVEIPRLREEYLAERRELLEGLAKPLRDGGLKVETAAHWADPGYATIIREAVAAGADLIVLHARRHGAISRLFLTNDDWQMVRCSPVPLLLVKERAWAHDPRFLVAVDPMHHRNKPGGLDHKLVTIAQEMAGGMDGDVQLVHAYGQLPLSGTYLKDAESQHRAAMDELMADFAVPESNVHIREELPEFALRDVAESIKADVVVMGAVSRNLLADVFIGNTTERVLDYIESDILVIKPDDFVSPVKL